MRGVHHGGRLRAYAGRTRGGSGPLRDSRSSPGIGGAITSPDVIIIQVLALIPAEGDRRLLRDMFAHTKWRLQFAGTLNDLRQALRHSQIGVVITDCRLPDCSWNEVLEAADQTEGQPSVIVISRVADERLWAEVLSTGGFDLVLMPFDCTEVLHCIASAWRNWRDRSVLKPSGKLAPTIHASASSC
jgi:DNA-binding NtrC family response regulator